MIDLKDLSHFGLSILFTVTFNSRQAAAREFPIINRTQAKVQTNELLIKRLKFDYSKGINPRATQMVLDKKNLENFGRKRLTGGDSSGGGNTILIPGSQNRILLDFFASHKLDQIPTTRGQRLILKKDLSIFKETA